MKKILFSTLILSLLLATLTACGAEAQQPTTPEPAPKIEQSEPVAKPEPLAASEKTEISQEELEPIFEQVYTEACENHPENWSVDFQITDEIGKVNKAIPEDKKAPANLREIYIEWRAAKTEPDTAEPEPEPIPEPEPEIVPEPVPEPEPEPVAQQTQTPAPTQKQETPSSTSSGSSQTQSSTVSETPSETPAASTSTSTTYPAGTTVTGPGGETYTSTGEVTGYGWVLFNSASGGVISVNPKTGTQRVCITGAGADVDLGDGGQAMADAGGMSHDWSPDEHNFNGES